MSEDISLGNVQVGFNIKLDGIRSARAMIKRELEGIGNDVEGAVGKGETSVKRFESSWGKFARSDAFRQIGHSATLAGGAIVGAFGYATKAAMDYDQALRNVSSIAKLSEQQFAGLRKEVLSLVDDPSIRQGPTDLAKGLYDVYSSGFQGKKAMEVLKVSAIGASAGMTDTATASRVLMSVLNSGIPGVTSTRQAMDLLFRSVDLGVFSFEQLAGSLGDVLPTAKTAGVSLQEVSAALALMTRNGISVNEATTALNNLMLHIIKPGKDQAKQMEALGIQYGLTAFQGKGLGGVLQEMLEKTHGNKQKLVELMPEVRALKGLLSLTGDGIGKYNDLLGQMDGATQGVGSTQRAANEQMKGAAAQADKARQEIDRLAIEIGNDLLPTLRDLLKDTRDVVKVFHDLPDSTKATIVKMTLFGGVILGVGGQLLNLVANVIKLKEAFGGIVVPPVLARLLMGAGAGLAGGAVLAAPIIGGALGAAAIAKQNQITDTNSANDEALPGFLQTAQRRADVAEQRRAIREKRGELIRKTLNAVTMATNSGFSRSTIEARRHDLDTEIQKLALQEKELAAEDLRLKKMYAVQKARYDRDSRKGHSSHNTYGDSKPHVVAAGHEIESTFGVRDIGGRRAVSLDPHGHMEGRALDVMVKTKGKIDKAQGDRIAQFALDNMKRLGIQYVIWEQRINSGDGRGWRPMKDRSKPGMDAAERATINHYDHAHINFLESLPGRGGKGGKGGGPAAPHEKTDEEKKAEEEAERKHKRFLDSFQKKKEIDAELLVSRADSAFDRSSESLRSGDLSGDALTKAVAEARRKSEALKQKQLSLAKIKRDGTTAPEDMPAAEATYKSDVAKAGDDAADRDAKITKAKLENFARLKKAGDQAVKDAIANAEKVGKQIEENSEKEMTAAFDVADAKAEARIKEIDADEEAAKKAEEMSLHILRYQLDTGAIGLADYITTLDLKLLAEEKFTDRWMALSEMRNAAADRLVRINAEVDAKITKASLNKFDAERAAVDAQAAEYLKAGVDEVKVAAYVAAEKDRIASDETKERVRSEMQAAKKIRELLRGVGDDLGNLAENSIEHWRGFKSFFEELGDSLKATFAKLVANLIVEWAKLQLLGGAKTGNAGADGLSGILGGLFGKKAGAAGPGVPGAPGAAPGIMPGEQGGIPTGGAMGGLGGILGAAGPFAAVMALTKIVGPGGLVGKVFKPWGKLMGKVGKIFGFREGGNIPEEGGFVAEPGTGGEHIIPRRPSMAIPETFKRSMEINAAQGALARMRGAGGGDTHITVHVATGDINNGMDVEELGQTLAYHVQPRLATARPGR